MRYIGNKTKLLPFILRVIDRLGIRPGRAHDAFAGTAAVGRALKRAGWSVASSDIMTYSYVLQRAYVVAGRAPSLSGVAGDDPRLRDALADERFRAAVAARVARANGNGGPGIRSLSALAEYLSRWIEPVPGFVTGSFAPPGGRMYFTEENAARIDAARRTLHDWWQRGALGDDGYFVLLASLLEASDRVANTAGVYAAYIKSWQPNARRPIELLPDSPLRGPRARAHLGDATEVARELPRIDLLYIDPPYNARQYAGYYHVPEIIARGWFDGQPALKGKTGLLADAPRRSAWCSREGARSALQMLLEATAAKHVLFSYNTEGLLSDRVLRSTLREASADGKVRRFSRSYRRYRSDSDREGRQYKGDRVRELLYYARLR